MDNYEDFLKNFGKGSGSRLTEWFATRSILALIYDAYVFVNTLKKPMVLNIYASRDDSGFRESVYKELFRNSDYHTLDFWEDKFIYKGKSMGNSYTIPFPDNTFYAVITTKIILEHISEPELAIKEIARVLKPLGEAFIVAPFSTIVHQEPYDFFRYSEFGLRHLFKKANLEVIYVNPTNSAFLTAVDSAILFNVFRIIPSWTIQKWAQWLLKNTILPLAEFLDPYIKDQKRFSKYYICRVRKT